MKFAKRLVALLVVAVMLVSSCLAASAAASVSGKKTYTIEQGVTYTSFNITSGENGNTVAGVTMEFNPKDGYIPMAFNSYAGNVATLQSQYNTATSAKYGYDVAGLINGSFFDMAQGVLSYVNISNGILTCAHVDEYNREVVAFDKNGNMNSVWSKLEFKLFVNNTELEDALYAINKKYSMYKSKAPNAVYYYDTACGTIADSTEAGYEVVCQKVDGSQLKVGKTLNAKVLEVKSNTYATEFETNKNIQSDKFVLFVKAASPYAATLKNVKAGDSISIQVNETVASGKAAMENAHSTITNVGWIVKNGEDQTRKQSNIGGHSVTLQYRQTAFGQKADGTYVFFTSDGADTGKDGSITMRDVADYMISQGCVNVIRMDGGGSSAMYVKNKAGTGSAGYVQSSSRAVADTILVVKKSSVVAPDKPDFEGENVALNKDYEVTTHGNYTANLTDGNAASTLSYDANWFAFYNNGPTQPTNAPDKVGSVVIDLSGSFDINGVKINAVQNEASGVGLPTSVKVYLSDDGTNWGKATELSVPAIGNTATSAAFDIKGVVDGTASFVKLEFALGAKSFVFFNEIEVYGEEAKDDGDVSDPETSEPDTGDAINVALNKDYEGGAVSPAGTQYAAKLTDGIASNEEKYDSNWFGFYYNKDAAASVNAPNGLGEVVIDLEEVVDGITDVRVHVWNHNKSGIEGAKSITAYLSEDGENWGEAIDIAVPETDAPAWAEVSVDNASAKFVKIVVETQAVWTFLNEIEVLADPNYVPDDETSEPEVSEPEVSEPEVSEPETGDATNVALNKDYEAAEYSKYTANLTDGVAKDVMSYDNGWFAFYNNKDSETNAPNKVGTVVIDLDGSFDISGVKINAIQNEGSGIGLPAAIKVYLSNDGETWGEATELAIPDIADTTKDVAFAIEDEVVGTASYVKVEFTLGEKSFVFFNEIEVYGVEAEDDGDVSEPEVSEPEVSEPEVSEPEVSEPDVSEPDVSEPEVSEPEVSEPEVSEPEVSEPEVSDPDISEPGDGEGDGDGDTEKGELGDIDFDGDVDAADYILVKRSVLRTYTLSKEQKAVADIDADGDVDAADYVLVKRIVLGSYTVKQDN